MGAFFVSAPFCSLAVIPAKARMTKNEREMAYARTHGVNRCSASRTSAASVKLITR